MGTEGVKRFRLQVEMQCRCIGCIRKVEKAMANIRSLSGIETSVGDVDSGIVTVVGKVNPTEVCNWLKRKTKKNVKVFYTDPNVKVFYTDPPVENHKQKMVLVLGNSSKAVKTTPSAPPLQDGMRWALVPSGAQSHHESVQSIEEKIRGLEKARDALKITNLENELTAVKHELKQSRKMLEGSKKALLDSALNQLTAYRNLEALSQ